MANKRTDPKELRAIQKRSRQKFKEVEDQKLKYSSDIFGNAIYEFTPNKERGFLERSRRMNMMQNIATPVPLPKPNWPPALKEKPEFYWPKKKRLNQYQQGGRPPGNPPTRSSEDQLRQHFLSKRDNTRGHDIQLNIPIRPKLDGNASFDELSKFARELELKERNKQIFLYNAFPDSENRLNLHHLSRKNHTAEEEAEFEAFEKAMLKKVDKILNNIPKAKNSKALGGPIDNLGILSANPSLIMPQRGMNPVSMAYPTSGFTAMNVSGNHLRDKKGKYKFGGFTPTDTTTGMGGIAGMGSGLLASLPTPEGKSGVGKAAASGALAGIGMGASFGPIGMAAGAVIGGLTGLFKRKKEHEAEQEQARMLAEQKRTTMKQTRYNQDAGSIGLFPTDGIEGVNNYYTALGGFPASQYEAEDGEVITYEGGGFTGGGEPTAFNDVLNNLSSGMSVIDGNSHAQGGEMIQGGEFVFSKKMKSTKELAADLNNVMGYTPKDKSYAGIAESIGRKKGMLEEKLDSHDPIAMKTAEVMMERYDEALELVAFEQELRKSKAA